VSVELIHSALHPQDEQRIVRIRNDVRALEALLTRAQVRAVYQQLELARDMLSRMLDKADGKSR
jgi:hypothetical protein